MSILHDRTVIAPGDDLAAAIAAARPGAVLVLGPGRHEAPGTLVVARPLALLAAGDATLAVPALVLAAPGRVALRDLAVEGAVQVRGRTEADLHDVRVAGASGAGVTFGDDATGELRACLIERCGGAGLRVMGGATPIVEGTISLDNAGPGLEWLDDAGGEAHGNLCEGNALGIRVAGRARPALVHNTLRRNAGDAILYVDAAGGRAAANLCDANRGRDLVVAVAMGAGPLLGQNRAFVTRVPGERPRGQG